jgi:hypothetical protein
MLSAPWCAGGAGAARQPYPAIGLPQTKRLSHHAAVKPRRDFRVCRALLSLTLPLLPYLCSAADGPTAAATNNFVTAALRETNTLPVRVLVLNYDPILKAHKNVRLHQHLKWNDPRPMTTNLMRYIRESSGGFANYQMVEWIDVDEFPVKRDGFRYTEESFLEMWKDKKKAHQPDSVSYAAIFKAHNLAERVRQENITDIWIWGAPYFGTDEYAMKIPGDLNYFQTDNPWFYRPYDIPDCGRTVWVMGFNYEVGEDNALHSFGHRCEGVIAMTVGRGVWNDAAGETNAWSRFTRQATKYPEGAQVGNVHGGPNAKSGYDYAQTNAVMSAADDWFNYPKLTGTKTLVGRESWGGRQYHLNYMRWWLNHLPKARGTTEGFYNNWWRYVVDYDAAVAKLPPDGRLEKARTAMY